MRYFFFSILIVFAAVSFADTPKNKSLWESFVGFFSPDEEPQGEGPLYKELADLDAQIQRETLACARERRPQKKSRLKMHLDDLRKKRTNLALKIEAEANTKTSSSSSMASNIVAGISSSSMSESVSQSSSPTVVLAKQPEIALIFRDTVYVHDTLFVERCVQDSVTAPAPAPAQ